MSYFYNLVALKKNNLIEQICMMVMNKLNLQNVLTC